MSRGGKREGAGRNPDIDPALRLPIGAKIQSLLGEAQAEKNREERRKAVDPRLADEWSMPAKLSIEWARKNDVSLTDRDEEGRLVYRKAWYESPDGKLYQEDVKTALREIQGIQDDKIEPNRFRQIPVKRIKGQRKEIIRKVAAEEGISESMAEQCLKEFRRFLKDF